MLGAGPHIKRNERYVEIDRERGFARVTFSGPVTYRERMDTMEWLCPPMQRHGIKRLILGFSAAWLCEHQVGTREQLIAKIMTEPALHGCRIAFVNSVDVQGVPGSPVPQFEVRRFDSVNDAQAWLFQG